MRENGSGEENVFMKKYEFSRDGLEKQMTMLAVWVVEGKILKLEHEI